VIPIVEMADPEAEIANIIRAKDHYQVLGVPRDADKDAIKAAYKKLALRYHPDKNKHPKAIDVFRKVANSYDVLTNEEKRAHFDRFGND
jgi:DnaJ-class molecular chaperone